MSCPTASTTAPHTTDGTGDSQRLRHGTDSAVLVTRWPRVTAGQTVECVASCGTAPAMQVNRTYHEQLDEAKLDRILETLP